MSFKALSFKIFRNLLCLSISFVFIAQYKAEAKEHNLSLFNIFSEQTDKNNLDRDSIEIEKTDFGVVVSRNGPTKNWTLYPTVLVPNYPGLQYAWKIKTNCRLPVFLKEEFHLPSPPSTWKLKESAKFVDGGQECVIEKFQATDNGWIGHAWTVSHGDPPGRYEIKIFANNKLLHTFSFMVAEPALENESNIGLEIRDY